MQVHKAEGPRPIKSRQADSKSTAGVRPGRKLKGADYTARPSTEGTVGQTNQGEVQATDGSSLALPAHDLLSLSEDVCASTASRREITMHARVVCVNDCHRLAATKALLVP